MSKCDWEDDCRNDGKHPVSTAGYTFDVCTAHGADARRSQGQMAELAADLDRIAEQTRTGRRR